MRWFWIDRFLEFTPRTSAVAVKAVSMAEEHLHDLFPDFPVHPPSLIIEGMAQTAGMLVGEATGFREKVILAKINRATFHRLVCSGETLVFRAEVEQMSDSGASVRGTVSVRPAEAGAVDLVADIELMFSHIDRNLAGLEFPANNFVFTPRTLELLRGVGVDTTVRV
jgi:3-hydroxyacyl-[acyl-carrier-protein] dehydratase